MGYSGDCGASCSGIPSAVAYDALGNIPRHVVTMEVWRPPRILIHLQASRMRSLRFVRPMSMGSV
jgi:hypothetical protein